MAWQPVELTGHACEEVRAIARYAGVQVLVGFAAGDRARSRASDGLDRTAVGAPCAPGHSIDLWARVARLRPGQRDPTCDMLGGPVFVRFADLRVAGHMGESAH